MKWPEKLIFYSFLALFGLVPLVFLPNTSELFEFNKITLTYLITCFIAFGWASRCLLEKKRIFKRTLLDIPLLVFLLIQILSLLLSIDPRISWLGYYGRWNGGVLSLAVYAFLYWAAVSNLSKNHLKPLLSTALIAATVSSLYGILEHFGIDAHIWYQDVQNRVFSTLGQPNWLAAYLAAVIFIPLQHLTLSPSPKLGEGKRSWVRYGLWCVEFTLFLCLLFTKSRSGIIACGLGLLLFFGIFLYQNSKKSFQIKNFKFQIAAIAVAALLLTLTINNPIKDFVFKTSTPAPTGPALETGGTESTAIRKIVWEGALRVWQQSPKTLLLGTGPETFALAYYQFRPLAHNNTSEWELLYNKAHNEYLNYLSTTGLLGLASYLLLLSVMAVMFFKILNSKSEILNNVPNNKSLELRNSNLGFTLALLCGWLTILITNAPGFSVVVVQLFLFLFPALAIIGRTEPTKSASNRVTSWAKLGIVVAALVAGYFAFKTGQYWLADVHYNQALKAESAFTRAGDVQAVINGYDEINQAFDLNPSEPIINMQFGSAAAYVAVLSTEIDATASARLAKLADQMADRAVALSPASPSLLKNQARTLIFLSALAPEYFIKADAALAKAETLSPTDPRLPYNRGVIAKYQKRYDDAVGFFSQALQLKPDFVDAQAELSEVATLSAKIKP